MKKTDNTTPRLPRKKSSFSRSLLSIPYGAFMAIFIVFPLLILLVYAFTEVDGVGSTTWKFTLENFKNIFSESNMLVFARSLWVGVVTALICFAIGYPTAYFLANRSYNTSPILVLLIMLPMWMNFLLRTLATKGLLDFIGVEYGIGTVIFGMVYNFLPFMIMPIYTSISKIDNSLLEAASDLGASEFKTFFKVVFPLSRAGIVSGFIMVFTPAITTFVISDMLSNKTIQLIGNNINNLTNKMLYGMSSALSLIVLIFIGITMVLLNKYDKDGTSSGGGLW